MEYLLAKFDSPKLREILGFDRFSQSSKWKAAIWRWFINHAARRTLPRINYDECTLINYKSINVPNPPPGAKRVTNNTATGVLVARDAANTLLNPSLINHTRASDTFPRRPIARIDVIIADPLFTTVANDADFFKAARDAEFCIVHVVSSSR